MPANPQNPIHEQALINGPLDAMLLEIKGLQKSYRAPDGAWQPVIDIEDFSLDEGEQLALRGSSGSGKTTFLNLIAGILKADAGEVWLGGVELSALTESERDRVRASQLGFVFQSFHLLAGYTATENVQLGMLFSGDASLKEGRRHARELLSRLGLDDRLDYKPSQLSVGQRQRVALARALANRPRLVLADEPTGNLDAQRAQESLTLMRTICADEGAALLLVSHDPAILAEFERSLDLSEINRASAERRS
ncbi:MAG: ABC-type lipoprotein export system ATPase subunit [Planctomycetota bacterium]